MKAVLTAEEAKRVDVESIQEFHIPSLVLMERAALAATDALVRDFSPERNSRILCVCSFGNNGADGLAAARQLRERGYEADVLLFGSREKKGTEELERQRMILEALGIPVFYADDMPMPSDYDIIVDALFGIGLNRAIEEPYASLITKINQSGAKILSIDIASGVMASSGRIAGCAVRADETVTFGYAKRGHVLYPGASYAGRLVVAPIGFAPEKCLQGTELWVRSPEKEELAFLPARKPDSNKGTYGRALLVAGSEEMGGAACLAALAACHSGAGLVDVLTHQDNRTAVLAHVPEAIVSCYKTSEEALEKLDQELSRAVCAAAGPGLGVGGTAQCLVNACLSADIPLILDADALNCLAADKEEGKQALRERKAPTVITPHIGEMSRLTGLSIPQLKDDVIGAAVNYARETGVIVCLKDARTVITDGQHTYLNLSGNSGMSAGGSGDVLTGLLAGLFAQKYARNATSGASSAEESSDVFLAALGVCAHGAAGDAAAKDLGGRFMQAKDIVMHLSDVIK